MLNLFLSGCRVKIHKEHCVEDMLAPCKVQYDPNTAKELLLLAANEDEQKQWVSRLSKKIQKGGFKAVSVARSVFYVP
jgi:hypothetical protein